MRVSVGFQAEQAEFDVPDDRQVLDWKAPTGTESVQVAARLEKAIREPLGCPPLSQSVVPGDNVAIALGRDVPQPSKVLGILCEALGAAAVEPGAITILAEPGCAEGLEGQVPQGTTVVRHDPEDKTSVAYLASTTQGRRVYLNRGLTDADFVMAVGSLAFDPLRGQRCPSDVLFPGLSDSETRRACRVSAKAPGSGRVTARDVLAEMNEVNWLLGCHFVVGFVPSTVGVLEVAAGEHAEVFEFGQHSTAEHWTVAPQWRADLVIVGVGSPGSEATIETVAQGLASARRLVERGGKIVVLSRARGPIGPAMQRLMGIDNPRAGLGRLEGCENELDFTAAVQLAKALDWADVYLLSELGAEAVEDLAMIPIDRPGEARGLVARSRACITVSHADLVRVVPHKEAVD